MINKMKKAKQLLNDALNTMYREASSETMSLKKQLSVVRLERDIYKQQLKEFTTETNNKTYVHLLIHVRDNGEGVMTEDCLGV
jgi:hypothetical protein